MVRLFRAPADERIRRDVGRQPPPTFLNQHGDAVSDVVHVFHRAMLGHKIGHEILEVIRKAALGRVS